MKKNSDKEMEDGKKELEIMDLYLENDIMEGFADRDVLASWVVQKPYELDAFNCDDRFEWLNVQLPPGQYLIAKIFDQDLKWKMNINKLTRLLSKQILPYILRIRRRRLGRRVEPRQFVKPCPSCPDFQLRQ